MKCCKDPGCTSEYCESHEACSDKCKVTPISWDIDHQTVTVVIPFSVFENGIEQSHRAGMSTFEILHHTLESMRITDHKEA